MFLELNIFMILTVCLVHKFLVSFSSVHFFVVFVVISISLIFTSFEFGLLSKLKGTYLVFAVDS